LKQWKFYLSILSIYIFSLNVCGKQQTFIYKYLEVHNNDTRSANNLHLTPTNLTKYKKGAYYTGIKIFNYLPAHIKNVANETQIFKYTLKRFLNNSF